jgi:hypothetical protein
MTARILLAGMLAVALVAGIALYWLQVHAFYREVTPAEAGAPQLVSLSTGLPEPIPFDGFRGIDSESSPIRFRACFETPLSQALLTETFVTYPAAEPLVAPGWFGCFDARALGAALERGEAIAFLSVPDITYGVDRVIAVMPDGRAFAWHQINSCGAVVFSGEPAPDGCPPVPESLR